MVQTHVPSVDSVICQEVTSLVSCTFDELVHRLPAYSWAQVFAAVDRLSRQGTLTVNRTRCFGYVVSVGPAPPIPQSSQDRKSQALFGRIS
jgi:lysine/ornithine N-monooxygenase